MSVGTDGRTDNGNRLTQKQFDLTLSGARRGLLERLSAILKPWLRLNPAGVSAWLLVEVLFDIYLRSGRGTRHNCQTTQEEICAAINARFAAGDSRRKRIALRQVKQAVRILKPKTGFGWLEVQERKSRNKSLPAIYSIEWPNLEAFLKARESEPLPLLR